MFLHLNFTNKDHIYIYIYYPQPPAAGRLGNPSQTSSLSCSSLSLYLLLLLVFNGHRSLYTRWVLPVQPLILIHSILWCCCRLLLYANLHQIYANWNSIAETPGLAVPQIAKLQLFQEWWMCAAQSTTHTDTFTHNPRDWLPRQRLPPALADNLARRITVANLRESAPRLRQGVISGKSAQRARGEAKPASEQCTHCTAGVAAGQAEKGNKIVMVTMTMTMHRLWPRRRQQQQLQQQHNEAQTTLLSSRTSIERKAGRQAARQQEGAARGGRQL